jgi:hypothetical protein
MTEEDLFMAIKKILSTIDDITSVKNQRTEALIEAYSLVTMEDVYGLQTVIQPDCLLFIRKWFQKYPKRRLYFVICTHRSHITLLFDFTSKLFLIF